MLSGMATTDPALFRPVGTAAVLRRPLSPRAVRALLTAAQVANVAFLAGWRHRVAGPLHAGLLTSLLSYRNSWSMIYHNDNALVLHTLVLGFSPAADALSVDRLGRRPARPRRRYGRPIRLMNAACALTYLLAGVAKLKSPLGLGWASGQALRGHVAADGLRKSVHGGGLAPPNLAPLDRDLLWRTMAVGSLIVELGAPAALLDRRLGRAWALSALGMHWGIYMVMRIRFRYQMSGVMFAPFFAVGRRPIA